jgi:sugar O-acyltransferase (sialic acid O-acetyltransferase NeuD family)
MQTPSDTRPWADVAFLDSNPAALDGYAVDAPILGDPSSYCPQASDVFVCALGDPKTKLFICRDLKSRGATFWTLRHPTAIVGDRCRIGEGCVLCPHVVLTSDVTLGRFVTVNAASSAGHDAVIGDGSTLSGHVDVTGFVRLGKGVFLGSHAVVLPGVSVGDYARIGAGSVVMRTVGPGITVFGVPARAVL